MTVTESAVDSTVARPTELWSAMPGWGILVDLTPPELLAARRLRSTRRLLAVLLALVLALAGAAYFYAGSQRDNAAAGLTAEQATTTRLQAEQRKFAGLLQTQTSITQVQTQIAGLMASDVDVAKLVGSIRAQLTPGMTLAQIGISIDTAAQPAAAGGTGTLDTSGERHIGSVTLTGKATRLTDVSTLVDRLRTVDGIVEPYPVSNQQTTDGASFSVQLTLTATLLTHRFDTTKIGGK